MPAEPAPFAPSRSDSDLVPFDRIPGLRVLAWQGDFLYASRGYELLRGSVQGARMEWQTVGRYRPPVWRDVTSKNRLASRLVRDGFHALAITRDGHLIAAVPGAIVTLAPGQSEFRVTHRILRGTRPLHITATPEGSVFFGEYFDNAKRDEVHIYSAQDQGHIWQVAHTFPKGAIRHVHNIVHDPWGNCLWIFTGDYGQECRILRASCDLKSVEPVLAGNQQARAVATVAAAEGLYFASDTPLEANHIYHLDRNGAVSVLADIDSSSIHGCRVGGTIFFTTMVEPSEVNPSRYVSLYAGERDRAWRHVLQWKKDRWPMRFFQYGNAFLPTGDNETGLLALTTSAVEGDDLVTSIYKVKHRGD
jgi:hypothetical protein